MTLQETKYSSSEFYVFLQKNKFSYIVSTIVEIVTCCSLVVLIYFFPSHFCTPRTIERSSLCSIFFFSVLS